VKTAVFAVGQSILEFPETSDTMALVRDAADCAAGTRATATEFGLDFLPLGWEALDLALPKEIFFRHLFQHLLARLGGTELRELARQLGGYDLTPLGQVLPTA